MVAGRDDAQQLTLAQFNLQPTANTNCPRDAWFWPKQRVLACCKGRKLRNGRMYTIVSLGKDDTSKITVQAEDEAPITLHRGQFFRAFRLPYAVTYASCQGLTLTGLVALYNTDHLHFNRRMLYVAMSRATAHDKLVVY